MHFPSAGNGLRSRLPKVSLFTRFAIASLVAFTLIGFGVAATIDHFTQRSAVTAAEQAALGNFKILRAHLNQSDLQGALVGESYRAFDGLVHRDLLSNRIKLVRVWNPEGIVVYSNLDSLIGRRYPLDAGVETALSGKPFADLGDLSAQENASGRSFGKLLQVYIPIRFGRGAVDGVVEVNETYGPVAAQISQLQRETAEISSDRSVRLIRSVVLVRTKGFPDHFKAGV